LTSPVIWSGLYLWSAPFLKKKYAGNDVTPYLPAACRIV
jgi:hypothetical protein